VRGAQDGRFVERLADELKPERQAAMPGRPARFTVTVKTSFRYIETGSAVFSPTPKAGPGVAGVSRTSHFSNAWVKSRAIRVRSFWARA